MYFYKYTYSEIQRTVHQAFMINKLVHCTELFMFLKAKDNKESAENCNTFHMYGMIVQTRVLQTRMTKEVIGYV